MTFDALKQAVAAGEIDTVLVATTDMQGRRLMGKRFHRSTSSTARMKRPLLQLPAAIDMEMTTVQGYKATGWSQGYGDYVMKPDMATLRRVPWLPARPWCSATCLTTTAMKRSPMPARDPEEAVARAKARASCP